MKASILQLLGYLCEAFPEAMSPKSAQLLQLFLDSLHKQFKSAKPDMKVISGGIQGTSSLLVNFSGDFLSGWDSDVAAGSGAANQHTHTRASAKEYPKPVQLRQPCAGTSRTYATLRNTERFAPHQAWLNDR